MQSHLQRLGIEDFLPVSRDRGRELPLFPGYVFGCFDPRSSIDVLRIPGVVRILGTAAGPIPINAGELAAVRLLVSRAAEVKAHPYHAYVAGEAVTIEDGPLAGITGSVLRTHAQVRVVVSIELLRRAVAAEVPAEWLRPVA